MAHWYTADPHFGHENIIKFCRRPFKDAAEMDSALCRAYQSCVGPEDDLWIVGDFAHGARAKEEGYLTRLFQRLPGRKHLVVGNHDGQAARGLGWTSISEIARVKDGEHDFTLCHYPMITWDGARRGGVQLFGHVHENWRGARNSVNVGVDVWDYRPVRAREILARARDLPVNVYWSEVERGVSL